MNNSAGGSGEKVRSTGVKHTKIESESDSSDYSSSDRSFDSQMTLDTSYSSESLNRGRGRGRGRNKNHVAARSLSRKRDRNGFGQGLSEHHRGHHRTHNNHSDIGHGATMPPRRTSSIDIHRVIDDAYLAGVLRERNERARREARHSRLNPRIISGSRLSTAPYGRYIPTSDRQGDIDDEISRLNDLSIGDEDDDYDAVLRRVDSRRRREFEYLVGQRRVDSERR